MKRTKQIGYETGMKNGLAGCPDCQYSTYDPRSRPSIATDANWPCGRKDLGPIYGRGVMLALSEMSYLVCFNNSDRI